MQPGERSAPSPRANPGLREYRWLLAVPLLVILCYIPLVFVSYGFSEDYRLLADFQRGATFRPLMLAEGRPGFALWARLVFSGLSGIGSLALVRFGGILLVAGLGVAFAIAWRRIGWPKFESALAGTITVTLPSFQLFVATAAMGGALIAAALGAAAAFLARSSLTIRSRSRRAAALIGAAALLLAGVVTYQPGGLIFVAFVAIFLIAANPAAPEFRSLATTFTAVAIPALLIALAIFLAGRDAYRPYLLGAPRADFARDPANKALWFLFFPLPQALNLWKLRPDLYLALAMMIALPTGFVLHFRGCRLRFLRATAMLLLLPLSYLPNLVVVENHVSFRSLPALAALVLVCYLVVLHDQFGRTRPRFHRALLCVLAAVGLLSAARTTIRYIAHPQARELAAVRATLNLLPDSVTTIVVSPSDWRDSLAPSVLYDEFGYPSTSLPWSAREIAWLVMRELRPSPDTTALRILDGPDADSTATVIDWGVTLRTLNGNLSTNSNRSPLRW